tara:strand:+ start:2582 stop:3937 length:1356 start_codon:yes stop_codon:yes gene_type:complete
LVPETAVLNDVFIGKLRGIVKNRLSTARSVREQHGHDESYHASHLPDAVVFPTDTEEVIDIVKVCAEHGVPVIPFGTGTSLEGHVAALRGGVCINLMEMNKILEVNAEDMDVRVQPGVKRKQLNEYLRDTGLFFPIDPGADASLGGMAATRASGTNAVLYGTMRENVLAMEVVLADGRLIKTARRARKSAAGYDLTRLFVGSEGTLGVITEITLKLYGIPEAISAAVASFPDLKSAVNTVIETIHSGIPLARIELLDEVQMEAINKYSGYDYPVKPTLFFEFHGSVNGVKDQSIAAQSIASELGAADFQWATRAEDRARLWQARHDAYYAALALRPGAKGMATDVCVPLSRLTECILETKKDIEKSDVLAPIVGHVGDGNFHLVLVMNPDDPEELEQAKELNRRMIGRALSMEGTCTGEHGEALSVMIALKTTLDPGDIMNPGEIVDLQNQ